MSQSVDQSFVRQYERDVHHIFQRQGGYLRMAVRMKNNVVGRSTTFQKIGKGAATTKARHGVITPMNQDHTPIQCNLEDFYAGDWVDKLDEAKIFHDERNAIAKGGAWALGRKVDDQILVIASTTSETTQTWTTTSAATVRNSLLDWITALFTNDVNNDGELYATLSTQGYAMAATVEEFSNADFVAANGRTFVEGAPSGGMWKDWMNVKWKMHTGGPGHATATSEQFAWHKTAIGYATGKHSSNVAAGGNEVMADITWHGDRAAHFVNHLMSGGACLIDTTGVIQSNVDDTASLPTT